jgi:hypothetical protein
VKTNTGSLVILLVMPKEHDVNTDQFHMNLVLVYYRGRVHRSVNYFICTSCRSRFCSLAPTLKLTNFSFSVRCINAFVWLTTQRFPPPPHETVLLTCCGVFCEVGAEILYRRSAAGFRGLLTVRNRLHVCGLGCDARSGCFKTCPAGDCVKVAVSVGLGLHFCPACLLAAADFMLFGLNFRAYVDIPKFGRWFKMRYSNFDLLPRQYSD